ncbi:SDR family oxidoreductase [Pseudomonas sp. LY-1]|uniref:SDR family oxidoreductase n=1 Tax=Pseudomonas veronii TaxID=76761 RepID=A0ABS0VIK4_PSEVE|nr:MULTISPECIES: SDR family oxidoreductase [Pseudomonas]MBI6552126.1 SDR family oxidoreductase [Pseudomonas veronii]MBI6651310.1 SDR family oxidoreductase [Pseudomonas veronii]WRU64366.1 SDR family oxidoreductase [Pseudomonas veronii]
MQILLTGASGFVGRGLVPPLLARRHNITAAMRNLNAEFDLHIDQVQISGLSADQKWQPLLAGKDLVIHLAARVHVMSDNSADPLVEYRRVNVDGTLHLARQAADAGVKRFIFISSIKVNGESTTGGMAYTADGPTAPTDPYGISKMEAERGLRALADETGMEVVIIRPVLVYGPGVQANFLSMMRWLHKGLPLPLGAIDNQRSLVALDNLVDLIVTCVEHSAAANQTFLVSDGEDLSTTTLLRRMAKAIGKPAHLLPLPAWMLEAGAAILGRRALAQRLCGSLQVDISKTRELLGWTPPCSVDDALRKTGKHFLELHAK